MGSLQGIQGSNIIWYINISESSNYTIRREVSHEYIGQFDQFFPQSCDFFYIKIKFLNHKSSSMKEYIFAIALTVFLFGGADDARSESDKCLNFGFSKINDDILKVADKIKSAMAASDICVNMVGLPSKRGTEEFRLGKLDGYGLRPSGWTKSNDLPGIRVPTKLLTSRGYFISREMHDDVMSVLKKKRVGIIRGSSWSDRLTAGSENAVEMTNASQLIYKTS